MTLQLDLSLEEESVLKAKAARLGMSLDRYARGVLRRDAEANGNGHAVPNAQTRRAARRALEELAAGTRAGLPPIPDEALTSANLYAERGE